MKKRANAIIPSEAITDKRVLARDLRVLCLLAMEAGEKGWCRASQVRMAKTLRCTRGTIQRSIIRLCAAGYIERRNRTRVNGKTVWHPFSAHTYKMTWIVAGKRL